MIPKLTDEGSSLKANNWEKLQKNHQEPERIGVWLNLWSQWGVRRETDWEIQRLLLTHEKTPGFLASGREKLNPGSETKLDHSELLCNRVLLKYKRDRESFWHRHQKGAERMPPC